MIEQFHFLRPWWLLALLLLVALAWTLRNYRFDSSSWRAVIDPRLLPFLLSADDSGPGRRAWWLGLAALLAIIALAGPTWEKLPQPVYNTQSALVIALDLSRSMDAADIKPSRLTRARHKIADILKQRKQGQTALVVYAADAFTVTPLTDDVETILAMLPSLDSGIMPAQGSRAGRALELALELFANSGQRQGDVLLVSDGVDDAEALAIEAILGQHPRVRFSVLALGSREGGPIPLPQGGFLKDAGGAIVIARLQEANLRRLARSGNGAFATLASDDSDINALVYAIEPRPQDGDAEFSDSSAELWRELGPWLVLLMLPLAAYGFRRGILWTLPLCLLVGLPPDAHALEWQDLWKNPDQRAAELLQQGDAQAAAGLFKNPEWKASSQYRAGDYESALQQWQRLDDERAQYNRGNALAKLGRYPEAIEAYEQLLQKNPQHEDARYNRERIEELMQQQQQQQSGDSQQGEQQQGEQQQGEQQQGKQQQGEQQQDPSQQSEQQQDPGAEGETSDTESSDQAESQQSPGEQKASPQQQSAQEQQAQQDQQQAEAETQASLDQKMSEQAAEQWLRKIPDDPGGLLRRKFLYQYKQRGGADREEQSW